MSSERGLWRTLRANLGPYGVLHRVENSAAIGTADVAYCINRHAGWLELKEVDAWPKKTATPLRIKSLTLDQVIFLEQWSAAGGAAYLLLQVDRDYLLLNSATTRILWGGATKLTLEQHATVTGSNHLPTLAIVKALTDT